MGPLPVTADFNTISLDWTQTTRVLHRSSTDHGQGVELFERGHGLQQDDDDTPTLHSLYGPCQQVWGDCFKILEENKEPIVTSDSTLTTLAETGVQNNYSQSVPTIKRSNDSDHQHPPQRGRYTKQSHTSLQPTGPAWIGMLNPTYRWNRARLVL